MNSTAHPLPGSSPARRLLPYLLVFAATFLLYLPYVRNPFVDLDDDLYVNLNHNVMTGLSIENTKDAFTTFLGGYYIPITWLSFQLDASLSHFGPHDIHRDATEALPSATVFHLDNTLQHAIDATLLLLFLTTLTRRPWASCAAALLWALHPLRVESVAWVTERKDTLAALFGFLALYLYTRSAQSPPKSRARHLSFVFCHVSFVLSLLAKPLFVAFPIVLLLFDWWPLARISDRGSLFRSVLTKLPLFAIAVFFAGLAWYTQKESGATDLAPAPFSVRLLNACLNYYHYLCLTFAPVHLSLMHAYNFAPSVAGAIATLLLLIAVTVAAIRLRRRWPHLLVGWLWFTIVILPNVGIVQSGFQLYADRFTLLPSVGLFIMLAYTFPAVTTRATFIALAALVTVIAGISAALSVRRLQDWTSSTRILKDALATAPVTDIHLNAAISELRDQDYVHAADDFLLDVDTHPMHFRSYYDAASCRMRLGDAPGRWNFFLGYIERFSTDPNPESRSLIPIAHDNAGLCLVQLHDFPDAYRQFLIAAAMDPKDPSYPRHAAQVRAVFPVVTQLP